MKKFTNTIKNAFKMFIMYLAKFITIIAEPQQKKEIKTNKQTIKVDNIDNKKQTNKKDTETGISTVSDTGIPEDPTSIENKHDIKLEELDKTIIERQIIYDDKKFIINDEIIDLTINKVFKEEFKVDIKKESKDKEKEKKIKKYKKDILVPKIKRRIVTEYITTEKELYNNTFELVIKTLKEEPKALDGIVSLETVKQVENHEPIKEEKKETQEPYFIASPYKKEINLNPKEETPAVASSPIEDDIPVEMKEHAIEQLEKNVFMVQTTEEIPKLELKEEISNVVMASALILASVAKEIVNADTSSKDKEEQPKEHKKEAAEVQEIVVETEAKQEELPTIELPVLEVIVEETKQQEQPRKEEKKEETKETKKDTPTPAPTVAPTETKEEKKKKDEPKKEQKEEPKKEIPIPVIIPTFNTNAEEIEQEKNEEAEKEEFEDKNYDELESKIDKALIDIEMFYLRNEKNLTEEQKKKLRQEQDKLRNAKDTIQRQKDLDIEKEKQELENPITEEEVEGYKAEIERLKLEHLLDLNEHKIKKIEELSSMEISKAKTIQKALIKKKLHKASVIATMSSVLAFPFIRNRYFRYFTAGMVINTYFGFIASAFRRKTMEENQPDLSAITQGKHALNESLNVTYENIEKLHMIHNRALIEHPELQYDEQYIKYVTNLNKRLTANYKRLQKKQQNLEKLYYKSNKRIKVLKRKMD